MISCIFLKGHVKSTHKMPDVVREAVGVALPAEAESGDLQSMGMAVGGRTQREQATFCLDLAYCLVWRHQTRNASRAKWAWQDSSPQGMFNWLITRYKWCELYHVLPLIEAQDQLMTSHGGILDSFNRGVDDFEPEIVSDSTKQKRRESNALIKSRIRFHLCIPITLGQGHTSIEDKCGGSVHQLAIDSYDIPHLEREHDEFISDTTDLGVEVGTADFHSPPGSLQTFLPEWFFRSKRQIGVDDGIVGFDGAQILPTPAQKIYNAEPGHLRRNAFPIPGCNHLLDSITRDTHHSLREFDSFLEDLHCIEQLLAEPGRRERYVVTCVLGTAWANEAKKLRMFKFTLYTKKWLNVVMFMQAAAHPVGIMRRTWREALYAKHGRDKELSERDDGGGRGKKFQPHLLTRVLRSGYVRGYYTMLIKLKNIVMKLQAWFEACPCHCDLADIASSRRKAMKVEGLVDGTCPFMSCRIWELIDEGLADVLKSLRENMLGELVATLELQMRDGVCEDPLTDEGVAKIVGDFNRACQHYTFSFSVKFGWTQVFPWVIMVLCHPVQQKQLEWAKRLVDKYNCHTGPVDRRTAKFMHPSSQLRRMLDEFIDTQEMHPVLRSEVSLFRFVPLSDRPAEAEHIRLKDVAKQQRGTKRGCKYSLAHRLHEIREASADPTTRELLIDAFLSVSDARGAIDVFGLDTHPTFAKYYGRERAGVEDRKVVLSQLEDIVYRQDLALKY